LREVTQVYKLKIIAVGKMKEKYWLSGISEYKKRLSPYARVDVLEVKEEGGASLNMHASLIAEILAREGEGIRKRITPGSISLPWTGKAEP
jgi:23S rRNA (pseudouridine1915-N3)-methyltransferase